MLTECPSTANTGRNDPEHAVRGPGQPRLVTAGQASRPAPGSGRRSTGERGPPTGVIKQLIPQGPENRSRVTPEKPHPKIFETRLFHSLEPLRTPAGAVLRRIARRARHHRSPDRA